MPNKNQKFCSGKLIRQMTGFALIRFDSRKWTLWVIFHYFNLAVWNNAWLENQRDIVEKREKSHMDLLKFTMITAEDLVFSAFLVNTKKQPRPQSSTS